MTPTRRPSELAEALWFLVLLAGLVLWLVALDWCARPAPTHHAPATPRRASTGLVKETRA